MANILQLTSRCFLNLLQFGAFGVGFLVFVVLAHGARNCPSRAKPASPRSPPQHVFVKHRPHSERKLILESAMTIVNIHE